MLGEARMERQATGSDAVQQQPEALPFVSSRYNFCVPVEYGTLLYNANSGAVINLTGADSHDLAQVLSRGIFEVNADGLPEGLIQQLIAGGFLVPSGTDEVAIIRERY